MRIACLGGGPAGLYFAIAMKLRDPAHDITVVERNRPYDTFGWGVVLSDETLANLQAADPVSAEEIRRAFVYWDDIAVHYRGTVMRSSGHGFSGVGRKRLLNILQDRAKALGVKLAVRDRDRQPRTLSRLRPDRGGRRRQLQGAHGAGATFSSPTSMCAPASTSGSARTRSSTTPSPSFSRRRSTAGSGCTPTSSMPRRRRSSSSAPRRPGAGSASTA